MKPAGILLLGGSGFVGQQLLKQLPSQPGPIYVLARSAPPVNQPPGVTWYRDSLDNVNLLDKLLPQCQWVLYLASDSTPGSSALQPSFELSHNLLPMVRFLEVLQRYPAVKLLYVSSGGAVYGNPGAGLARETTPLFPISYYGAGKAALEKFIIAFSQQSQRTVIIVRPSNFYGPEQPHRPGFGVIATLFQHILSGQTLPIWGDGEAVRDYLYITDFVALCLALLQQPVVGAGVKIYNAGSGQGTTLNQLCLQLEAITQRPVLRQYQPARNLDVRHIVLDCTQARQDYGWSPTVDLQQGLRLTWDWVRTVGCQR